MKRRLRLSVSGIVQGVGFRPFVARLAASLSLTGLVRNTTSAVVIEIEGTSQALQTFTQKLETDLPRAATIDHIHRELIDPQADTHFHIAESQQGGEHSVGLPPDLAICPDCQREQDDPNDRRYNYPFLNCTLCGPRYSIVHGLPYDRPRTTMQAFPLCKACAAEYHNPADRRYHAQPIACPICGPSLSTQDPNDTTPLTSALQTLSQGHILAVRGIGGFHLACDARNPIAVERLRNRKARGDQPFALMVRDLTTASEFVHLDEQSERLLSSAAAPIVLLPKRNPSPVGDSLAPRNGYLGVMLPYSPLHRLLLRDTFDALVMTSGNRHGEPIATICDQALRDLSPLADSFLFHNRDIVAPADDSVVRLWQGKLLAIRRGRGYAPLELKLPISCPPALAVGAELKAAFALAQHHRLYVSPHIGDMENLATITSLEHTLNHLTHLYGIEPQVIFHDAHPGYLSTHWAQRQGKRTRPIQHHRAHVASVVAEYAIDLTEPITAVVYDGTGYGDDGAIWGGEVFTGTLTHLNRIHHLPYVQLPGGDAAAKRPALSAIAHLQAAGIDWATTNSAQALTEEERRILARQLERNLNCHSTSSMGRLFDAASSLLGIRHHASFEAQAAIEMEAIATQSNDTSSYHATPWNLHQLWLEILADHATTPTKAARFHHTLSRWTASTLTAHTNREKVILGGGVFQNVLFLTTLNTELKQAGFHVLTPRYLPPNDGGLAVGQMLLGALLESESAPNQTTS